MNVLIKNLSVSGQCVAAWNVAEYTSLGIDNISKTIDIVQISDGGLPFWK